MNNLTSELAGYIDCLQRLPVALQALVVVIFVVFQSSLIRPWRGRRKWFEPCLLIVLGQAGESLRLNCGILKMAGLIWMIWYLIPRLSTGLVPLLGKDWSSKIETRVLRPLFFLATIWFTLNLLGSTKSLGMILVGRVMGVSLSVGEIIRLSLSIYLLLILSGPIAGLLAFLCKRAFLLHEGANAALTGIIRYTLLGIGISSQLLEIGISGRAFIAVVGGFSVGLGFGFKELISGLVSGIVLLLEGSIRPGKLLIYEGELCEVLKISMRTTLLCRQVDDVRISVPNEEFFMKNVMTVSKKSALFGYTIETGQSDDQE